MSYTKEQIIEAFEEATGQFSTNLKRDVMAILEKPKPVFEVGEVVANCGLNSIVLGYLSHPVQTDHRICRHLNKQENPAAALAIERLERLASVDKLSHDMEYHPGREVDAMLAYARQSLEEIKAMVHDG